MVGRNGMGKTTLCKAIMGLVRASSGSIRFAGEELVGRAPADIARLGIGYVPQGRRLWRSLTVDEHLRLVAGERRGAWTIERIYDTFPRLAERKSNAGSQLSGGEQQMLAISRALLLNPRLLVMDEPTEGLAPVIVAQVDDILVRLAEDGEIAVLVIEQKIGVATAVAETVAIMVNGRINRLIDSRELAADRDLQQRLLGVGRHGHEDIPENGRTRRAGSARRGEQRRPGRPHAHLHVEPAAADALVAAGPGRADRGAGPHELGRGAGGSPTCRSERQLRQSTAASEPFVLVAGTLDTKGDELRFIRDILKEAGLRTRLVDLSTSGKPSGADVPPTRSRSTIRAAPAGVFTGDRGTSVAAMAQAFEALDQAPDRRRRHHLGRRLGRHRDGGAGHARAARRRSEGHDLDGRVRRRAGLRRPLRHHDDVLGHRRAGPQLDLAAGARQRRPGDGRHGQDAACRRRAPPGSSAGRRTGCPRSASPCSA